MKILFKPYIFIPLLIILIISSFFWGWYVLPTKSIDIVVINKTVNSSSIVKNGELVSDYRKHKGFFWMLDEQRYVNAKTNKFFNLKTDYYGPYIDSQNKTAYRTLDRLDKIPDMIYLSDSYGDGIVKTQKTENKTNGITLEEVAAVNNCFINGSTVVGEFNILSKPTSEVVRKELQNIFSVDYTGWSGKYIVDMADHTDLPEWIFNLYETEYGEKWNLTGAGIIFVSDKAELIVLKEGTDYKGNSLKIVMDKKYSSYYGAKDMNYFNWFEVVRPKYGANVLANYVLDASDSTKLILNKAGIGITIPAIISTNANNKKSYYFAGDFTDYTSAEKYSSFIFADKFNQTFSFERLGDTGNFYWHFYLPLIERITKDAYNNSKNIVRNKKVEVTAVRIKDKKLQIEKNKVWTDFSIRGFNINGIMPGSGDYQYTEDVSVYREWITDIGNMGGNCVRVYDLMPPAFYRAVDEQNRLYPDKKIYFFQNIVSPDNAPLESYSSQAVKDKVNQNIVYTINALHGIGTVPDMGSRAGGVYTNDVSEYLLGYIVEHNVSEASVASINKKNAGFSFSGTYFSGNSSPSENIVAATCDKIADFENKTFKTLHPIGAVGNQVLVPNSPWVAYANNTTFDVSKINVNSDFTAGYFTAYSLQPADKILLDNTTKYASYKDEKGSFPYGGYINVFKGLQTRYPILIDKFGLPTNMNAHETATAINGLTEYDQGNGIVRMMKAIDKENYLGGLVYEFSDSWNRISDTLKPYTLPIDRKTLWHNALDPEQNYGVMAIESDPSVKNDLILRETGIVDEVKLSSDETYFYATMLLKSNIDYSAQAMTLGFDTYDRNSGEYIFNPSYFGNSWSGMEYVVRFDNKQSASLYVVPSYDIQKSKYFSVASYKGSYDFVGKLKYGNFDASNNNFYQTGTSIYVRIPWASLNFADPSRKMVISDNRAAAQIKQDVSGLQTQYTNGILFSVIVSDKQTKDTLYLFPATKMSTGYKVYSWEPWEKPSYRMRLKTSYNIIGRYFSALVSGTVIG